MFVCLCVYIKKPIETKEALITDYFMKYIYIKYKKNIQKIYTYIAKVYNG